MFLPTELYYFCKSDLIFQIINWRKVTCQLQTVKAVFPVTVLKLLSLAPGKLNSVPFLFKGSLCSFLFCRLLNDFYSYGSQHMETIVYVRAI